MSLFWGHFLRELPSGSSLKRWAEILKSSDFTHPFKSDIWHSNLTAITAYANVGISNDETANHHTSFNLSKS